MAKRLIIGLGTGHCGTRSLAKLLALQENCLGLHEFPPPVAIGSRPQLIQERMDLFKLQKEDVVADVAFWYLPFVEEIMEYFHDVLFICLERPKQDFVKSVLNYIDPSFFPLQYFKVDVRIKAPEFGMCFPQYAPSLTQDEALGEFWEDYRWQIRDLMRAYPNHIRYWPTEALNDKTQVKEILTFLGFDSPVIQIGIKVRGLGMVEVHEGENQNG